MTKKLLQNIYDDKNSRLFEIMSKQKVKELIDTDAKCFNQPWYGQLMREAQIFAYLIQVEFWLRHFNVEIQ